MGRSGCAMPHAEHAAALAIRASYALVLRRREFENGHGDSAVFNHHFFPPARNLASAL